LRQWEPAGCEFPPCLVRLKPDSNGDAGWCRGFAATTAGGTGAAKFHNRPANQPNNMSIIAKSEVITQYKIHDKDTGSSEVQVALLTARINHLTEHLRLHRKDFHSRRGLLQMASRRRKLLDYLKRHDLPKYNELLQKLSLRK
jgi:small subunit ribosomal protein S15